MTQILVDRENVNDDTVLILEILYKDSSKVRKGDLILIYETSKTAVEVESPEDGYLSLNVKEDDEVDVGSLLFTIEDKENIKKTSSKEDSSNMEKGDFILTKSAQKKLKELGIKDYSFDKKIVNEEDVIKTYGGQVHKEESISPKDVNPKVKSLEVDLEVKKFKVSPSKKIEIDALSSVQNTGLTSTIFAYVTYSKELESSNPIISNPVLPIIINKCSELLEDFPLLNSYFEDNTINQYVDINLGIAIDLDKGLKVFTMKNTNNLDLVEIEKSLSGGIYSYFKSKLSVEEITGSTFTISDLSAFGVDRFIPLVNYKQSAILGISSVDKKLERLNLSLTFDHRITEGKMAAQFLSKLVKAIEEFTV